MQGLNAEHKGNQRCDFYQPSLRVFFESLKAPVQPQVYQGERWEGQWRLLKFEENIIALVAIYNTFFILQLLKNLRNNNVFVCCTFLCFQRSNMTYFMFNCKV